MNQFDQALERLDKYIWYMANRFRKSLQQGHQLSEVADLHQVGMIKLYEVYTSALYEGKPVEELDVIFKKSLHNSFIDLFTKNSEDRLLLTVDLEEIADVWGYDAFNDVYLKYYQEHLNKCLSPDAVVLLEHLLNPTPAVYHMANIQRMRREHIQRQGMNVRVPKKLTQAIVGQTLGFSSSKTKALLTELRQVWQTECQRSSRWRQSVVSC